MFELGLCHGSDRDATNPHAAYGEAQGARVERAVSDPSESGAMEHNLSITVRAHQTRGQVPLTQLTTSDRDEDLLPQNRGESRNHTIEAVAQPGI